MTHADVVVVGGGIGGAVLAVALARGPWTIHILEREPAPPRLVRPELLWSPTLDAFDALATGSRIRAEAAVPVRAFEARVGARRLFRLSDEELRAAGAGPVSVDAGLVRQLLLERALASGRVALSRGAEVTELARESRHVRVRARLGAGALEVRGTVVVGDDGARSLVRRALGIPLDLTELPAELIGVAASRPPDHPADEVRAYLAPSRVARGIFGAIFAPAPGDRILGALALAPGSWRRAYEDERHELWRDLARFTPLGAWLSRNAEPPSAVLHRPWGHAATYVADGAALLGDAAHPITPAGGQGANAAVADALALAGVLDAALRAGDVSVGRLLDYERARRAANDRSLSFSRLGTRAIGVARAVPGGGWLLAASLRAFGLRPDLRRRVIGRVSHAFVTDAARP